jgi:RNA polymerase sigma factor (sigma-70 family)
MLNRQLLAPSWICCDNSRKLEPLGGRDQRGVERSAGQAIANQGNAEIGHGGQMMEPNRALGSQRSVSAAVRRPQVAPAKARTETFAGFYRREYDRAIRLAWLLTGSLASAEDVVQDAMTGVYRTFERLESPEAYLRRAVVNQARSRHRDERRRRERATALREQAAALDRDDAELLEVIARLPYRQRVVIVTRYWGGWSERDIARALRCRPGTVKSLASRALTRLRSEVQP